ncbi:MAG: SiaC family regulatory phosphoprotein [Cyclobacteriaceae bacterium]|nr:SiaC family regulatory phosphoprotein [Cyclobacteriaceae bacterium]MCK5470789.1 SiaC family regulatory phosphoprotein [Cyclobacteriaceae bacterium]MCK5703131.1 SiaC family regulatory phosphoprotein [Cyclobacteriaceae bacterium]
MEEFILEAGERHPEVHLRNGFISIKGHSIPLDARKLYKPVLLWVKAYLKDPPLHTEVSMQIDFSDSASSKAIFDILKTLAICQNTNHEIELIFRWIYLKEDETIKELGEFFENKLNVTFNYDERI